MKRGRKPKEVKFTDNNIKNGIKLNLPETVILHLPITLDQIRGAKEGSAKAKAKAKEGSADAKEGSAKAKAKIGSVKAEANLDTEVKIFKSLGEEVKIFNSISLLPTSVSGRVKLQPTDICCWNCTYPFDTPPICSPDKYVDKTDTFKVSGCFCSFNCVLSYKMSLNHTNCYLVSFMHKKMTGIFKTIKKAPNKYCLNRYGGPISIESYRETFTTSNTINILVSPMIFVPGQIEEKKSVEMLKTHVNRFKSEQLTQNKPLTKLKISQAVNRKKKNVPTPNKNTLDIIMGFK